MVSSKDHKVSQVERRARDRHRPRHETTPVPARTNGVVTRLHITAAGEQAGTVRVIAPGTDVPALVVELPGFTMQFLCCEQVQHVLGLFALARQARMGMPERLAIPGLRSAAELADMHSTLTWTRVPMGAASRSTFTHPVTRNVTPCVTLSIDPVAITMLDTTAIETTVETMQRAHKLAVATFDDGYIYRHNSAAPSWTPRAAHRFAVRGTGWLVDHPDRKDPPVTIPPRP
ncbi:hypothetical protein [Williamsia serinedens]|uniref:Uncharacterized protein n=1 Tax=Williamsia serinedens TaxID=391736 RepID=A0ABT1H718_9NOCA|nr:hypothetical protein [Williamsia serinedens]MCP2163037.1 hypothetical protein [Williamsia serinedens]